jgi:hypothetical protein
MSREKGEDPWPKLASAYVESICTSLSTPVTVYPPCKTSCSGLPIPHKAKARVKVTGSGVQKKWEQSAKWHSMESFWASLEKCTHVGEPEALVLPAWCVAAQHVGK